MLTSQLVSAGEQPDIRIRSYTEKTIIHSIDSGFTRYVTIYGISFRRNNYLPISFDPTNYDLSDFTLYYKKNYKYKRITGYKTFESPDFSGFYRSNILKFVQLDSSVSFLCTFKLRCRKIMLFNTCTLFSQYVTDTIKYQVSIPNDLSMKYDSVNFDSLPFHKIMSYAGTDSQHFEIRVSPFLYGPGHQARNCPIIRLLIVPAKETGHEAQYLNRWYLNHLESVSTLDQFSKNAIDSLLARNKSNSLIPICYDYIRTRFKYIDVEMGMGAVIPHDVNTVLQKRQGDCKDLSSLLCAMLKYKGFDANLALAATVDYFCDFDFPTLASANHLICTVKSDSGLILLDPTDISHMIGQPVQSLQGKTIFVTGPTEPYYYRVPVLSPGENNFNINLNLTNHSNSLEGNFRIIMSGYIGNVFKWTALRQGSSDLRILFEKELKEIFQNQSIDGISWIFQGDSLEIRGRIKYSNRYYMANNIGYLYMDFIPQIFSDNFHKHKIREEILLGTTVNKNLSMVVNFNDTIHKMEYNPLFEKRDPCLFDFTVDRISGNSICIRYSFEFNKIRIEAGDFENVNTLIDEFNRKSHETIVLHF